MAQVLQLHLMRQELQFGTAVVLLTGPAADLIMTALRTMQPAEKVEMMRPPTARSHLFKELSQDRYDQLVEAITHINQALGGDILKSAARPLKTAPALQAKLMLGDKALVKAVECI